MTTGTVKKMLGVGLVWAAITLAFWAGKLRAHDGYNKWMQPHRPGTSCCSSYDCAPVAARYDQRRGLYEAMIDGAWRAIPPWIVLDPKKPENHSPDGGYHACWNRTTGELLCFREAEPKI